MNKETYLQNFFKAILAGLAISIGGMIFLSLENSFLGSVMFSFGLLTILYKGWNLYTGKVGYVEKLSQVLPLAVTLLGNLVGLTVGAVLYRLGGANTARLQTIMEKKLSMPLWRALVLSILCGVMMYLAVSLFRSSKNPLMVVMPISIFIVCGFEHSMASYFFLICAMGLDLTPKFFAFIGVLIIGNAIGSLALAGLEKLTVKKTEESGD